MGAYMPQPVWSGVSMQELALSFHHTEERWVKVSWIGSRCFRLLTLLKTMGLLFLNISSWSSTEHLGHKRNGITPSSLLPSLLAILHAQPIPYGLGWEEKICAESDFDDSQGRRP